MNGDKFSNKDESNQRLQKTLQGAFSGPPTPLKDIPTKAGESRKLRRKNTALKKRGKRRRQAVA